MNQCITLMKLRASIDWSLSDPEVEIDRLVGSIPSLVRMVDSFRALVVEETGSQALARGVRGWLIPATQEIVIRIDGADISQADLHWPELASALEARVNRVVASMCMGSDAPGEAARPAGSEAPSKAEIRCAQSTKSFYNAVDGFSLCMGDDEIAVSAIEIPTSVEVTPEQPKPVAYRGLVTGVNDFDEAFLIGDKKKAARVNVGSDEWERQRPQLLKLQADYSLVKLTASQESNHELRLMGEIQSTGSLLF